MNLTVHLNLAGDPGAVRAVSTHGRVTLVTSSQRCWEHRNYLRRRPLLTPDTAAAAWRALGRAAERCAAAPGARYLVDLPESGERVWGSTYVDVELPTPGTTHEGEVRACPGDEITGPWVHITNGDASVGVCLSAPSPAVWRALAAAAEDCARLELAVPVGTGS